MNSWYVKQKIYPCTTITKQKDKEITYVTISVTEHFIIYRNQTQDLFFYCVSENGDEGEGYDLHWSYDKSYDN